MLKLTYSNLEFQNFLGRTPRPPSSRGGEEREREGKWKGRREGKDREGTGREGGEEWRGGGEGRGGALDMGSAPPPRDKLWIRPCCVKAHAPNKHNNVGFVEITRLLCSTGAIHNTEYLARCCLAFSQ